MMTTSTVDADTLADLPPGMIVTALAIGVALIGLHAWLSRRDPVWLGALVPLAYVGLAIVLAQSVTPSGGLLTGYGCCLVALLVIWWAGEDTRKAKRASATPAP